MLESKELFSKPCTFIKSVAELNGLPDASLPEITFAGRSNVGKSSLINALIGVQGLARTSNTPGRTQYLNYFDLGGYLFVVDMPGYGYAKAPLPIVKAWNEMIRTYMIGRPTLLRVYLLIDARHGIKKNDKEMMEMLDATATSYQIVLTKIDKIGPSALDQLKETIQKDLVKNPAAYPEVICTSSAKKIGIDILRDSIVQLIQERAPQ